VDELNASIGVVRVWNGERKETSKTQTVEHFEQTLRWVQNKLFDLGGLLATTPGEEFPNMPRITEEDVTKLEQSMDACQEDLAPLKEFILPGGGRVSGFLHQSRTVCRRAERVCITLARQETVDPILIKFLNRLSDALFVWARWIAKERGEPEFLWERDSLIK
jgi:cob(I)alamin adenosyltransferase